MAKFRLEALAPRRYCLGRDKAGQKRWATFTAEDCRSLGDKANRMLAAGVSIPVCWEHRDDANPARKLSRDQWATEQVLGTAGWVERYEIDADGRVWANIEVPDPADAAKAEALRYCSPEVQPDVLDGDGREWGRAFAHLALTPRPINQHQKPIQRLSGAKPVARSVSDVIRLSVNPTGGEDMADEKKDDEAAVEEPKPPEEKPKTGDGLDGGVKELIEALRAVGMLIPDEVMDVAGLIIAIKASGDAPTDDQLPEIEPVAPGDGGGGTVAMSLQKQQELAEVLARKNILTRIDRLLKSRRVTPEIAAKLTKAAGTVKLSFGETTGDLEPNDVLARVEAYEELPKDAAWAERQPDDKTRLSRPVSPGGRPRHATREEVTDADAADESIEARRERMKAWDETTGRTKVMP